MKDIQNKLNVERKNSVNKALPKTELNGFQQTFVRLLKKNIKKGVG